MDEEVLTQAFTKQKAMAEAGSIRDLWRNKTTRRHARACEQRPAACGPAWLASPPRDEQGLSADTAGNPGGIPLDLAGKRVMAYP
jgi:hypothetical protein